MSDDFPRQRVLGSQEADQIGLWCLMVSSAKTRRLTPSNLNAAWFSRFPPRLSGVRPLDRYISLIPI